MPEDIPQQTPTPDNTRMQIVVSNLITLALALSASFVTYKGQESSENVDIYKAMAMQVESQRKQLGEMQAQIIKSNMRIIELEAEVRKEVSHDDVLRAYFDSLPAPAWIKRARPNGEFEMYMINSKYSHRYGISKQRYEGKTDRELGVFAANSVSQWAKNDEQVYLSGGSMRTKEYVYKTGIKKTVTVWKFAIELPNGKQGVGGLVIDE